MDANTEIDEGAVVCGTSTRTRSECIFEVRAKIKGWVKPFPGTIYIIEEDEHHLIKLRSPMGDSEVSDTTLFNLQDCYIPSAIILKEYLEKPNI